jgi:hypothetical protein
VWAPESDLTIGLGAHTAARTGPQYTKALTMIPIGFHTDAFNSSNWSSDQAADWASQNDVPHIECGAIDGVTWLHGLGYHPSRRGVGGSGRARVFVGSTGRFVSQIDAAFPLNVREGTTLGIEYVKHTIRWAKLAVDPVRGHDRSPQLSTRDERGGGP